MIKHTQSIDKDYLTELAYKNIGANYFILLGLSISEMVYSDIYYFYREIDSDEQLEVVLLKRRSGNLQLICLPSVCNSTVIKDFHDVMSNLSFKTLITSKIYGEALKLNGYLKVKEKGALISEAYKINTTHDDLLKEHTIQLLHPEDVDAIEILYKQVFDSFTPPEVMRKKLYNGRGRGVGLFVDGKMIATAQTDFETNNEAIIVGVATHPDYQHQGYGQIIMSALCKPLIHEGKKLILHYNNPIAGKLYDKMDFKVIDQIYHYQK